MRFDWSYPGMGAYLRGSRELYTAMNSAGRDVKRRARAIAVREAFDTGRYSESFQVVANRSEDGRVGVRVENTDGNAAAIEFGSAKRRRALNVLRRAAEGAE